MGSIIERLRIEFMAIANLSFLEKISTYRVTIIVKINSGLWC